MPQRGYDTNLASEFYILSVLYRLGLEAYMTLSNKKAIDIIVNLGSARTVTIDVKGVKKKNDWWLGKSSSSPTANHFVVLVGYEGVFANPRSLPRVWVLPHSIIVNLTKHTPKGVPFLSRKEVLARCAEYEDNWQTVANNAI